MIRKAAVEGVRAAYSTRLATMPDATEAQRAERRLVAQFVTELGRLIDDDVKQER